MIVYFVWPPGMCKSSYYGVNYLSTAGFLPSTICQENPERPLGQTKVPNAFRMIHGSQGFPILPGRRVWSTWTSTRFTILTMTVIPILSVCFLIYVHFFWSEIYEPEAGPPSLSIQDWITLQGTVTYPPQKGTFAHDFPFPEVGYVSFQE